MAGRLVTVATFDLPAKARLAENILTEAGIKATVADENTVAMDWLLGAAVGWVKVQVLEEDADRAVAVLEESLGGDPVDPEELAAEAEAARDEDEAGDEAGEPAGVAPAPGAAAAPVAVAVDELEPPRSERDEYARRLLFAAVFSLIFAPLWFYALYLLMNAALGEGPISDRGRSHLFYGLAVMGVWFVFFIPIFLLVNF